MPEVLSGGLLVAHFADHFGVFFAELAGLAVGDYQGSNGIVGGVVFEIGGDAVDVFVVEVCVSGIVLTFETIGVKFTTIFFELFSDFIKFDLLSSFLGLLFSNLPPFHRWQLINTKLSIFSEQILRRILPINNISSLDLRQLRLIIRILRRLNPFKPRPDLFNRLLRHITNVDDDLRWKKVAVVINHFHDLLNDINVVVLIHGEAVVEVEVKLDAGGD